MGTAKKAIIAALCWGGLLAGTQAAWGQVADWHNFDWGCRRKLTVTAIEGLPQDRAFGTATFLTMGAARADGSDVRIVTTGREIPSRIIATGPGDSVTVAFALAPGQTTYYAYFGNPKASAPTERPEIKAGLLLEVRELPKGNISTADLTEGLFSRAKIVEGAGFVDNVFSGFNQFGSPTDFVARYSGWLNITKPGTYIFASSSTHNSFLLVDGKTIVECHAREGPPGHARFTGSAKLEAGFHEFEYYHAHKWGDPVAVAAWQPPGVQDFAAIPPQSFVPIAHASVGPLQKSQGQIAADFTFARSEAVLTPDGNGYLERYRFTDRTAGINHANYTALWDFGDGVTSTSWEPAHVYLADGPEKVTLTVQGPLGKGTSTQQIVVARNWTAQTGPGQDELKSYYDMVKGYDFTAMATTHLVRAAYFFERLEKYPDMVAVAKRLIFERKDLTSTDRVERGSAAVEALRNKLNDRAEAMRFLKQLEDTSATDELKARFALTTGEVGLDDLAEHERLAQKMDEVRGAFNRVLATYAKASQIEKRRALIGLGTVAWYAHDGAVAGDFYRRAEKISLGEKEALNQPVMVGHLARVIESMLREGELEEAELNLAEWEWEKPTDRLAGYSTVLRARLLIARRHPEQALRQLEALVAVSPRSLYAPEALMQAANCLQAQEKLAEAAKTLRRIITDYPESDLKDAATKRLKTLEQ